MCRHTARINTTQNRRPSAHAYHATIALGTVLAMLAGAVVADLACGDGRVVFGGALASVTDRLANESAGLAGERLSTATLELTNTGGCQGRRAGLVAFTIHEVPAVAAHAAGVTGGNTVAPVAVRIHAPTARASLGAGLDPATLAGN